jgi:hypothetical protein
MIDWTQPAEVILSQLLEVVEQRIPADKSRDDTAWVQLNRIAHVFDSSTLKDMKQSLVRNGYEDFYQILIGGDDFGKPKVQQILDALGQIDPAVFTPVRVETMKSWGVDRRPRWQIMGLSQEPTIESVREDRNRHGLEAEAIRRLAEISLTRNQFDAASAFVRQKIESGQVSKLDVIEAFSLEWSNTCPH